MSESTTTGAMGGADWESLARGAANEFGNDLEGTVQVLRELLVFGLDGAAYAVPVERVREIVRMRELTTIPRAPGWLLGVVALRGEVVLRHHHGPGQRRREARDGHQRQPATMRHRPHLPRRRRL